MKMICLIEGHCWQGCQCQRCAVVRDEGHVPERHGCYLRCRLCEMPLGVRHQWDKAGCKCLACGLEQHLYLDGQCVYCGKTQPGFEPNPEDADPHCGPFTETDWTVHP